MFRQLKSLLILPIMATGFSACATQPDPGVYVQDLRPYTITFRNFSVEDTLSILSAIDDAFPGENHVGDHEGGPQAWRQNVNSSLNSSELSRELFAELNAMGLSEHEFRLTVREQGKIEIAKLALKQVR